MAEPIQKEMNMHVNPEEFKIHFITGHDDYFADHGIGWYNGDMHEFYQRYSGHEKSLVIDALKLSHFDRIKWFIRRKLFELCVGKHYTYVDGKRNNSFYIKKPDFIYKKLYKLYYKRIQHWF